MGFAEKKQLFSTIETIVIFEKIVIFNHFYFVLNLRKKLCERPTKWHNVIGQYTHWSTKRT